MHIKRVQTVNLKGRTLDLYLSPVTVIAGDNFSGKTTVPTALRLGLTGYLPPPIGKTSQAIYGLAGNPDQPGEMTVALTTSTDREVKLRFTRTAKGKVSLDGGVPSDLLLPGLLVEPSTFFGLTGSQRMAAIFAACDPAVIGVKVDDVLTRLRGIAVAPRQHADPVITTCCDVVKVELGKRPIADALASLEERFKDAAKSARQQYATESSLLGTLSTVSRERPVWDKSKYEAHTKALAEANFTPNVEIGTVGREIAGLERQLTESEETEQGALHSISELDDAVCCPTCRASAKGWRDKVKANLGEQISVARKTQVELNSKLQTLRTRLAKLEAEDQQARAKVQETRSKLVAELATINTARGEEAAWLKAIKQRDDCEARLMKTIAEAEVYKQAVDVITTVRAEAIAAAVGSVLKVARGFTDDLLNSPIELANGELGRRVSKLDCEDGNEAPVGSWIPHEGFSGTEQLLAYAGFAVALSRQAPIKLVIMDELGRLTLQRRVQLIGRMDKLVRTGVIDQFIGCDVEALDGTAAQYVTL